MVTSLVGGFNKKGKNTKKNGLRVICMKFLFTFIVVLESRLRVWLTEEGDRERLLKSRVRERRKYVEFL